jgi:hypothetical protein
MPTISPLLGLVVITVMGSLCMATAADQPQFDVEHWKRIFPYPSLFRPDYPRHFNTTPPDSPLDLRKPSGEIICTPKDLIQVIQVREAVGKVRPLRETSHSDVFVWGKGAPPKPYFTKVGGVPYRPRNIPWPAQAGMACTFLFQIYFGDSRDLLKNPVPGDVMVVFGNGEDFWTDEGSLIIEWYKADPAMKLWEAPDLPPRQFWVPELTGHLCRIPEYEGSAEAFEKEGHNEVWLLDTVQATKIGSEIQWIQGSKLQEGERLIAAFSSINIRMKDNVWPLVDVKEAVHVESFKGYNGYQNELSFSMADVGCIYFIQNQQGKIRWEFQSY